MYSRPRSSVGPTKVSDRMAPFLLATAAATFSQGVTEFTINQSSIKRKRTHLLVDMVETLNYLFKSSAPLTVHWDGKRLPQITGKDNVEPLFILIPQGEEDQLLGEEQVTRWRQQ